jgi:hypothetical protein
MSVRVTTTKRHLCPARKDTGHEAIETRQEQANAFILNHPRAILTASWLSTPSDDNSQPISPWTILIPVGAAILVFADVANPGPNRDICRRRVGTFEIFSARRLHNAQTSRILFHKRRRARSKRNDLHDLEQGGKFEWIIRNGENIVSRSGLIFNNHASAKRALMKVLVTI